MTGGEKSRAGMRGKRRHSQYPFLPRHLSEKRAKRQKEQMDGDGANAERESDRE